MESELISAFLEHGVLGVVACLFIWLFLQEKKKSDALLREVLDAMNNSTTAMHSLKEVVSDLKRGA